MESHFGKDIPRSDLTALTPEKSQHLDDILKVILKSSIAQDTFAQIIDGRPAWESQPSDEAREKYHKFRANFSAQDLKLDTKLVRRYEDSDRLDRDRDLRLLEISAASIHALAGIMHASSHPEMTVFPEHAPALAEGGFYYFPEANVHVCCHKDYVQFQNYPRGLLDVVGYWAETQIFGGVLLFKFSGSGSQVKSSMADDKPHWIKTKIAF